MVGELLAERYQVLAPLRSAGLATTYRALDQASNDLVALVLVPVPPEPRHMLREFAIGSRLSHPNLLAYKAKVEALGHAGLVVELVVGDALVPRASLPVSGSLAQQEALAFLQLCDVLDYLHSQGLVHGNLAPDGLLVQPSGQLKVLHLGHCEDLAASERFLHDTPHGTPLYSSPEHFGGLLAPESDYFVVGVLLWERLTNHYPFPNRTLQELLTAIRGGARTLSSPEPLPHPLASVVRDLLEIDFSARRAGWQRLRRVLADG